MTVPIPAKEAITRCHSSLYCHRAEAFVCFLLTLPQLGKPNTATSLALLRCNWHLFPGLVQFLSQLNSLGIPLPDAQDYGLGFLSIPSPFASCRSVASKFYFSALELVLPLPGRIHLGLTSGDLCSLAPHRHSTKLKRGERGENEREEGSQPFQERTDHSFPGSQ